MEAAHEMLEAVDALVRKRADEPEDRRARAELTAVGLDPAGRQAPPAVLITGSRLQ